MKNQLRSREPPEKNFAQQSVRRCTTVTPDDKSERLPEEQRLSTVLWAVCLVAGLFVYVFAMQTACKAKFSPQDITSNWFVAWGTWASGLMAGAAFLIAASSIAVSSAYSRQDRRDAANVQASKDIAQARLLTIYPVDMPRQPGALRFFRIDNRSSDLFFDVSVPGARLVRSGVEEIRITPAATENTLQLLPQGEILTPYRTTSHEASWFTEVRIEADLDQDVEFSVCYTDASGSQWQQALGGHVERVFTTRAVPRPRHADLVQPYSQLEILTEDDARELAFGGALKRHVTGEDDTLLDATEIELLSGQLVDWTRVERLGTPRAHPISADFIELEIPYGPKLLPSHPWNRYFRNELAKADLIDGGLRKQAQGNVEAVQLRVPLAELEATIEKVSVALESANEQFEAREYRRARATIELKRRVEAEAAEFQRKLDERTAQFSAPGQVPWHIQRPESKDKDVPSET